MMGIHIGESVGEFGGVVANPTILTWSIDACDDFCDVIIIYLNGDVLLES